MSQIGPSPACVRLRSRPQRQNLLGQVARCVTRWTRSSVQRVGRIPDRTRSNRQACAASRHVDPTGAPQCGQNRAPGGLSSPHLGQRMPVSRKVPLAAVHCRSMHYPRRQATRDRRSVDIRGRGHPFMLPALPHQRRALVHRVQPGRDHHRANDRHWNGYDLRGSEHQQPGQHHRRTGRSHVVHRQRQHYWPDHHLSDTHDQSIHPHLGSGRNNGHHHRPQPGQATKVSFRRHRRYHRVRHCHLGRHRGAHRSAHRPYLGNHRCGNCNETSRIFKVT